MTTAIKEAFSPAVEGLMATLAEIEEKVVTGYTLADAMREGSTVTTKAKDWGGDTQACALSAAAVAATARGYC